MLQPFRLRSHDDDNLWKKEGENLPTRIFIFQHFRKYNPYLLTHNPPMNTAASRQHRLSDWKR